MPSQNRIAEAGFCYHAINRGNARQEIFHKPEDYEAFIRVLAEGLEKYPVELFSFSLMPNHWHLVLRPQKDGQMGRLLRWVTATHSLRYHAHYHSRGEAPRPLCFRITNRPTPTLRFGRAKRSGRHIT